jgi:predicted GNAT family N-acyltransferase
MVVLDENDSAMGCAEVWKPQTTGDPVKFCRFAVLKESRDRKIGKLLLQKIESYATSIGAKEVYCNAQRISKYFYAHNGYIGYGDEFIDGQYDGVGGMPHIKMKKSLQ